MPTTDERSLLNHVRSLRLDPSEAAARLISGPDGEFLASLERQAETVGEFLPGGRNERQIDPYAIANAVQTIRALIAAERYRRRVAGE